MSKLHEPVDGHKLCRKCEFLLPIEDFAKNDKIKSGLNSWCKKCEYNKTGKFYVINGVKLCRKCNTYQTIDKFRKNSKIKSGLDSYCNLCVSQKKEKSVIPLPPSIIKKTKTCTKCLIHLPIDKFPKKDKTAYKSQCRNCIYQKRKLRESKSEDERDAENKLKEILRLEKKELQIKKVELQKKDINVLKEEINKRKLKLEEERLQQFINKEKNRIKNLIGKYEKLIEYYKNYEIKPDQLKKKRERQAKAYNKRISDPLFYFRKKLTNNIRKSLTEQGYSKNSRAAQILGADWDVIFKHFNGLFKDGMSWENHGDWHIDHIIPLSSANTEEDIIRLNHYTNLQPLWAIDNLRKSNFHL